MAISGLQAMGLNTAAASTASKTSSSSSSSSSSSTSSSATSSQLNMDAFLNMFMTQLKYQDPTNPLESYELAAQLAQFSTVEQLTTLNQSISDQQELLLSINYGQMVDMVGKEVVGLTSSLQVANGQASNASYEIGSAAADVTVTIKDSQGNVVRTMDVGAKDAGQYDVGWDGLNDDGEAMGDGTYSFEVEAVDADGDTITATNTVTDTVYAFRFDDGTPYLILGGADGIKLPIGSILEVHEPAAA